MEQLKVGDRVRDKQGIAGVIVAFTPTRKSARVQYLAGGSEWLVRVNDLTKDEAGDE